MDILSEDEQEHFLNDENNEKKTKLSRAISFCDGAMQVKSGDTRYKVIKDKCKSVECLREKGDSDGLLKILLSQSTSFINNRKQRFSTLSFNRLDSDTERSSSYPDECTCKCNQATVSCSSSGHLMQEGRTMLLGDGTQKPGVISVKLQHLNGQVLPDFSVDNKSVFRAMQQHRALTLAYETSQSSDSVICRICHSAGDEKLIAPCKCSGSSRYVHEPCLVTWFKKSVKNECELCRSEVKIKKINHSLLSWRKPEDRPIPLIWFFVFFIGLFLNILSIYVNASERCKSTACLIFYIVNGFGIILDSAFLYFWFLKCRHYCKKWFALNQDWFIDDLESAPVEYVRNETHAV